MSRTRMSTSPTALALGRWAASAMPLSVRRRATRNHGAGQLAGQQEWSEFAHCQPSRHGALVASHASRVVIGTHFLSLLQISSARQFAKVVQLVLVTPNSAAGCLAWPVLSAGALV